MGLRVVFGMGETCSGGKGNQWNERRWKKLCFLEVEKKVFRNGVDSGTLCKSIELRGAIYRRNLAALHVSVEHSFLSNFART
jgi:hypothetical protein